jgi:hypothetical protein
MTAVGAVALKVAQFNSPLLDALAAKSLFKLAHQARAAAAAASAAASAEGMEGMESHAEPSLPSPARYTMSCFLLGALLA